MEKGSGVGIVCLCSVCSVCVRVRVSVRVRVCVEWTHRVVLGSIRVRFVSQRARGCELLLT